MDFLLNPVDILAFLLFMLPLIVGMVRGFTAKTVVASLLSFIELIEMIVLIFVSVTLVRKALFEETSTLYSIINPHIPPNLKTLFSEREIFAYLMLTPTIFSILMLLCRIILTPLIERFLSFSQKRLTRIINYLPLAFKRILGSIWNIPNSILNVVILGFLLNFYAYLFPTGTATKWLDKSVAYNNLYSYTIKPVLQSKLAKDIPLILDNAFVIDDINIPSQPQNGSNQGQSSLQNRNSRVIQYFNGVTLDEAVKSNDTINNFAKNLTQSKFTTREKARVIYDWISQNITYDKEKAANITTNSQNYSSGAINAFETRSGICFDYSCLFVAMCRATDVKVSLFTGIAYNGIYWGDHTWNKFYQEEDAKWIPVDPTFGAVSNYFDKKNFYADHKYELIRGEW